MRDSSRQSSPDPLLTVKQVSEMLRLSGRTVYNLRKRGLLSAVKVGRSVRFELEAVRALIQRRTITGGS